MSTVKWSLIILAFATIVAYGSVFARDHFIKEEELLTEYGKAEYCYKTNDNFLICKLGE